MKFAEQLLDAMGGVGVDLVDMSETMRFPKSFWRRSLPVAACAALMLGLGVMGQRYLFSGQTAAPAAEMPSETAARNEKAAEAEPSAGRPEYKTEQIMGPMEQPAAQPGLETDHFREPAGEVYVLELTDDIIGPAVAVNEQGEVLLQTDHGSLRVLTDRGSGEQLALLWDHRTDTVPERGNTIGVYDLTGTPVTEVEATFLDCLGDMVMVNVMPETGDACSNIYRRSTGELLAGGLDSYCTFCSNAFYTQKDGTYEIWNGDGEILWTSADRDVTVGSHGASTIYLSNADGSKWGLKHFSGDWETDLVYDLVVDIQDNAILCREDESSWVVLDGDTGEVLFNWSRPVEAVYRNCVVATTAYGRQAMTPDGAAMTEEAQAIQALDDEGDGTVDQLVLFNAEGSEADYTCIVPGSDAVARYSVVGTAQNISSRTVVIAENLEEPKTGEWYMDVYLLDTQTGQRQEITGYHEFGAEKEYDFGEAIWLSEPDGSSYSTGLFQVTFVSPQGDDWKDLYREDGTLLLDNLSGEWQYLGDWRSEDTAVLGAERNGVRGLWRLDGTCLYREDQGEQRFDLQLSSQSSDCGSDSARIQNLTTACRAIDGLILQPGETFSFNEALGERTEEKGYTAAGAYDGESATEVGAGIGQVASMLYCASLKLDLKQLERAGNTYAVDYVDRGFDAAVYWGITDYRFVNSLEQAVKIRAEVSDGEVVVELWGSQPLPETITLESVEAEQGVVQTFRVYRDQNGAELRREPVAETIYRERK